MTILHTKTSRLIFGAAVLASALTIGLSAACAQTQGETTMNAPTADATPIADAKTGMLPVAGARLYYEVRGTGPTLLIIPGGPQDAGVFSDVSRVLADRYTVVTYDPRGNSRTTTDGAPGVLDIDQQGDDAAALIRALGDGPAYVFGTSGGAQIGLNLAARHGELVKTMVAHEPPAMMLLDDPSAMLAADQDIYDTYKTAGVEAAMAKFFGENGLEGGGEAMPEFDMPPEAMETFGRVSANFEYWLAHGMRPLGLYKPDVAALQAGNTEVVVALGEQSAGQPIAEMTEALAQALGKPAVTVPGDHVGFSMDPAGFAAALDAILRGY